MYEDITPHEEEDHFAAMIWNEHVPSVKEEEKEYPVIRRRSRSVGSRPLYKKQHDGSPPRINSKYVNIFFICSLYLIFLLSNFSVFLRNRPLKPKLKLSKTMRILINIS